jgi:hypothetical protein
MPYYANAVPVVSTATRTVAGQGSGFDLGEYIAGMLFIHITGLAGTSPTVTPSYQVSYNGNYGTAGRYTTFRSFPALSATGLSILTIPYVGKWGRVSWSVGGTNPQIRFAAFFVGSGLY